jgi:hypothetical protein
MAVAGGRGVGYVDGLARPGGGGRVCASLVGRLSGDVPLVLWVIVPWGVVTVIVLGSEGSAETSMR